MGARRYPRRFIVVKVPVLDENQLKGVVNFNQGRHTMAINTNDAQPQKVWVRFIDGGESIPVCGGDVDSVGYTIVPDGFVLNVNIQSDSKSIEWLAVM